MKNPVRTLRMVAFYEGISYLLLLGIAMPLKYIFKIPLGVKILGPIHGFLFVWLCLLLVIVVIKARWHPSRAALVFISSLLPFGPMLLDKRMQQWSAEYPPRS